MLKSYEYRLYPNKEQEILLAKHFGCNRFIYNWALNLRKEEYQRTGKTISKFDLNKKITELSKQEETIWLKEVLTQSLQQSIQNLDTAYIKFFKEKRGFPKFKSKKTHRHSYRIPQNVKINFEDHKVFLPKIKWTNLRIDRTFDGIIKSATVKQVPSGKYFVSILVEDGKETIKPKKINFNTAVGIDLGIKDFAILSNGEKIANPKFLRNKEKRLKILQKRLSRKQKDSQNRNKARIKVAKFHEKISNERKDFLQKLTTKLVKESQFDTFCLETLSIQGMMQNHKLAKSIAEASWYRFIEMLKYKCNWYGKNLVQIGRFEPSTKLCPCGYKNNELTLSDREWTCPICGTHHDRDILAANNIKRFALSDANLNSFSGSGRSEVPVEMSRLLESVKQEENNLNNKSLIS